MAYTVFALKWRPQDFESIVGQDHIVGTLKNAIQKNRLAHAYLFTGPRGVGKTSTARILAKALNCKEGPTVKPCQKCSSCLGINQGNSLDVIEIDGASNRGIDEIRALRENVKFSPTQGKYKVYIIDEVHQITPDGFNALLKTLEEPPEFVKFIFATTHPQKVMPTIISRCQRMDFRRITVIEIISQLEKIIREEKAAVDKEVLFAVAKSSDGSLRDAESILDQLVSFSQGSVSLKDAISVLGMVEQDVLFLLTDKIIQKDPQGALKLFNEIIDDGKDPGVFLVNLIEHFRNLMVSKVSKADTKLVDLPQEVCDRLFKQSQSLSLEEIFSTFNVLVGTQEMAKRLDSQRIPLEISLVRLAYNSKQAGEKSKIPAPKKEEQAASEETVKDVTPKDNVPAQAPQEHKSVSLDQVKNIWSSIVNSLAGIKMSVSTYLSEGEPTKVQGNILTVAFPKNYSLYKESLEKKENRALIEKAASELCNTELRINFILAAQAKQEQDARSNPFVKSALEMFGGRVVKEG
ncbi:MAG: DNA polymerase III subunit gamma/tau [Candidatus Omnitrophica bacterium]|nr:DNA polymerase III subunit gamma/tau [Candidatus Omnitrophota bacterium]